MSSLTGPKVVTGRRSGPISTVSFNSTGFLKGVLEDLVSEGELEFYVFIRHKPEASRASDGHSGKFHHHVYMVPAKELEMKVLRKRFEEPDPEVGLPRGTIAMFASIFPEWLKYNLHDEKYLMAKGLTREYHYKLSDMKTNDIDTFDFLLSFVPELTEASYSVVKNLLQHGYDEDRIYSEVKGNPAYIDKWMQVAKKYLGEEFSFDPETGEVEYEALDSKK